MNDLPSSSKPPPGASGAPGGAETAPSLVDGLLGWVRGLARSGNGEESARDTLEELIEEREDAEVPIDEDERALLANILELRGRTIRDVMVPLADIVAVSAATPLSDVIDILTREGHSRLPVYGEGLDDAIGMVHIKDVMAWRGKDKDFSLSKIQRRILFVSPSMQVLELLLEMRASRSHMALVVDEFGGVDGLVTIEDLVEEIVGEIEDEHDQGDDPRLMQNPDGSFTADARVAVEALEEVLGAPFMGAEREGIDTLGGLVFTLAGRVPIQGELIRHPSGLEFEVLDADPRHIKSLRVLNPAPSGRREQTG
ncbi:MAG: HlyC/CorC family transporter [Rhodospirillales bacterium]|nr:HlyC/CorC family transporter [Rhodospirillales bacterium]